MSEKKSDIHQEWLDTFAKSQEGLEDIPQADRVRRCSNCGGEQQYWDAGDFIVDLRQRLVTIREVRARLVAAERVVEAARALDGESHGWAGDDRCDGPKCLFRALRVSLAAYDAAKGGT